MYIWDFLSGVRALHILFTLSCFAYGFRVLPLWYWPCYIRYYVAFVDIKVPNFGYIHFQCTVWHHAPRFVTKYLESHLAAKFCPLESAERHSTLTLVSYTHLELVLIYTPLYIYSLYSTPCNRTLRHHVTFYASSPVCMGYNASNHVIDKSSTLVSLKTDLVMDFEFYFCI